jgi:hypothetical protein
MSRRIRTLLLGAALLLVLGRVPAQPQGAHDPYLQQLTGRWDMTGTLLGKPLHQRGEGSWLLKDGWLCFTIIDAQVPPAYQAAVYIGFDPKAGDYVAHWLDQFGAAGARVVGTGHRDGRRLVLEFPYREGAFRDTSRWSRTVSAAHSCSSHRRPTATGQRSPRTSCAALNATATAATPGSNLDAHGARSGLLEMRRVAERADTAAAATGRVPQVPQRTACVPHVRRLRHAGRQALPRAHG